jgi:hypothetical protein
MDQARVRYEFVDVNPDGRIWPELNSRFFILHLKEYSRWISLR